MHHIILESTRLNRIVTQILEISRSSSFTCSYHFGSVNVSALIQTTCDQMRMKGRKYNIVNEISANTSYSVILDTTTLKPASLTDERASMRIKHVTKREIPYPFSQSSGLGFVGLLQWNSTGSQLFCVTNRLNSSTVLAVSFR
jgi:hypothetical protein